MEKLKQRIEAIETNNNGLRHVNGAYVNVVNMRIKKDMITADVILSNDMEQTYQRYNNMEYPITMFKDLIMSFK